MLASRCGGGCGDGMSGCATGGSSAPCCRCCVDLDVRMTSLSEPVANLSGGNQQKVSLAKWLAARTGILIIDEPTVGIDVRTKAYLHGLIRDLARGGAAVLLISSDMPELIALADRIVVMHAYRLAGELANSRDYAAMSRAIMGLIHAKPAQA